MSCGELLPEEELVQQEDPATAQEGENAVIEEVAHETLEYDTEFYRKRERSRRVIEEAWPEEYNKPKSVSVKPIFDYEEDRTAEKSSEYARNSEYSAPQRPVLEKGISSGHGQPSTMIPKRDATLDPDDFFAVKGQVRPEYDDEPEERRTAGKRKNSYEYEDEHKQSFVVRHMRGVVTLLLLVITIGIVLIWANTDGAQLTLATLDIAWKPEAYARLGMEAYEQHDLSAAGYYYTQPFVRDPANYNYAVAAANSYIEGGYTTKALEAIRKCIELKPADVNLYVMLLELQPDKNDISEGDRELLRQGYRLTGDERLKIE